MTQQGLYIIAVSLLRLRYLRKVSSLYDGFKNPTAKPGYPHETTVYPNQKENHNTTENEWMHERSGDKQSHKIQQRSICDPKCINGSAKRL